MSVAANVLEVLRADRGENYADYQERQAAIAAVAELIEAAENVEAWITDYVPDDACGREVELRELSAALARVKGGAA